MKLHALLAIAAALWTTPLMAQQISPAFYQAQLVRLQDARQQVNLAENDASRALTRLDKEIALVKAEIARLTPTPAPVPAPTPSPTPAPAPHDHPVDPTGGYDTTIQPIIPSNFDVSAELVDLVPAYGLGAIPPTMKPDVVGAFRFICAPGQVSYDDPIVYPGQPGKSHLHQFFGNTGADANSTYRSLRETGDSTCTSKVNRSGYWIPAMLTGTGKVVRPDAVSIYYKRFPADLPLCRSHGNECVDLPRGLRFIFGYNMLSADGKPTTGNAYYTCSKDNQPIPGVPASAVLLADIRGRCSAGGLIGAIIGAPHCWDGKNMDSPDHRSHMADLVHDVQTGEDYCPASHPKIVPTFILQAFYTTDATTPTWELSSDMGKPAGSTFHADWWGAWDDSVMKRWTDNCINKQLNCSAFQLGDGTMAQPNALYSAGASPRVIDLPPR